MAINKVVYDGRTLIDITDSTVDASHLAEGYVAYNASGQKITGELTGGSTIIRDEQDSHGGTIRHIITDAVIEGTKQITSNGTYDVGEYASAEVDVEANLQSKTVNSSTTQQTVTADSGYDGLSAVTVNAIATATQATPSISVNSSGLITASATQTAGYVTAGTKSATQQLTTQAAKTVTPSETSQTAVASGRYTTGAVTVGAISSTYVGSGIDRNDSTDLTASGDTVTVPSGYYASSASKSVASGSAGTPTATKGTVSNHSVSVTPSVTNTTGYITGGTKTGTAVTVSASELVSGSQTVTQNNTYDVTNLASVIVNVSGGGGASNFVMGEFTPDEYWRGYPMTVSIPYTGNGYPVAVMIYPSEGTYNPDGEFYNAIQRYAFVTYVIVKNLSDEIPTYGYTTTDADKALIYARYKNSTSSATSYTQTGTTSGIYCTTVDPSAAANSCVKFTSATQMKILVADTSYGFMIDIPYTYCIVYSE